MRKKVETYLVANAIQALVGFCKDKEEKLDPTIIANFAIAWRESASFEWTPCGRRFRRINAVQPHIRTDNRVVLVFGYDGCDQVLTDELNARIMRATNGRWLPE